MRIFYYTFGCKVNQYETESIKEKLEAQGEETVTDHRQADVCIVNSCTVTSEADKKCRQLLHKIRKDAPGCVLVCAGCMTQAHKDIASRLPECDIIVGAHNKMTIPALITHYINTGERIVSITDNDSEKFIEPMSNTSASSMTRSYIKIQDGCDMRCSYCIIPNARGHIRSKSIPDIISEASALLSAGHRELILTGINLCCYGRENGGKTRLTDAVEAVCGLEGDFRVRLSSLEPELISDNDIKRLSRLGKLCPQFHLSLQSGCDRILKAMNRHYTTAEYAELCRRLRLAFPGCAITTDIMVGFPGETEQDHLESCEFVMSIGFAEAHIFPYSRRPDTPADSLPCQLNGDIKAQRAAEMAEICSRSQSEYLSENLGTVKKVLFERESSPEYHQGHTDNYILVKVPRTNIPTLRGRMMPAKLCQLSDNCIIGELCDDTLINKI